MLTLNRFEIITFNFCLLLQCQIEREGTVSPPSTENVEIHKRPGELKEVV